MWCAKWYDQMYYDCMKCGEETTESSARECVSCHEHFCDQHVVQCSRCNKTVCHDCSLIWYDKEYLRVCYDCAKEIGMTSEETYILPDFLNPIEETYFTCDECGDTIVEDEWEPYRCTHCNKILCSNCVEWSCGNKILCIDCVNNWSTTIMYDCDNLPYFLKWFHEVAL